MMTPAREPTAFQNLVYAATRAIPSGQVSSYGRIARLIGRGNARAVGTALSKNPFAPEVPCHRVVRADGSLGGFYGETQGEQILKKHAMLLGEGVIFQADGKVAARCLMD